MQLQHVPKHATVIHLDGFPVRYWPDEDRFGVNDMAQVLEVSRNRMVQILNGLSQEDKGVSLTYTPGGPQMVANISRSGVYQATAQLRNREKRQRVIKQLADLATSKEIARTEAAPSELCT
ncbi:MAG: hypothetical protein E6R03_12885, partial [Hyphomicrobiaceae bacterium]